MRSALLQPTRWQTRIRLAISMLALSACAPLPSSSVDAGDVVFLAATEPASVHMEALYKGNVVADAAGCLRLAGTSEQHTVVWPYGFELRQRDGAATVVKPGGREVGEIGGFFTFGGGEVPTLHEGIALPAAQKALALEKCPGRYWIVGEVP